MPSGIYTRAPYQPRPDQWMFPPPVKLVKKRIQAFGAPITQFAKFYNVPASTIQNYINYKRRTLPQKYWDVFWLKPPSVKWIKKRIKDLNMTVTEFCKTYNVPQSILELYILPPWKRSRGRKNNRTCYLPPKYWHLFYCPLAELNPKKRTNIDDIKLSALV